MSYLYNHHHVLLLGLILTFGVVFNPIYTHQGEWSSSACAQTRPEHRWSLVELDKSKIQDQAHPIWKKIRDGEPIPPLDWEAFALRVAKDPQRKSLKTLALIAAGLGWFREGLYFRAADTFSRIPSRDHPLTEIHLFFWAEALFHQGRYSDSAAQFNELARLRPGSLWVHRARFREVDLLAVLGDLEGALESSLALIDRYPEYPYRASAYLQAADLSLQLGRLTQARELLNQVQPTSLQAVSAVRAVKLLSALESEPNSTLKSLGFRARIKRAQSWRRWKNYRVALHEIRSVLKDLPPKHKLISEASLEELRILNRSEHFTEAIELNDKLNKSLSGHWLRSNWWWRSEALARQGKIEEAAQAFLRSRVNKRSAGSLARLGMIYFNGAHYPEAERAFKGAVERGEKGDPDLWMARRLLRWLPYRLGRYEEAARRFQRSSRNGRGSNHYAHYWWARSVHKLGQEDKAIEIYYQLLKRAPYSFYAYLAQMRLEEVGHKPEVPWRRTPDGHETPKVKPPPNPLDALLPFVQEGGGKLPLWEAIYGLTFIGERSWARIYLRSLTEENRAFYQSSGGRRARWSFAPRFYLDNRDDSQYGIWGEEDATRAPRSKMWAQGLRMFRPTPLRLKLIDAYRALGEHYYARRRSYYDGPKLTYPEAPGEAPEWQRRYPRSFRNLVESSAARYSVDPHLIWALMTVESSHNPWAISRVGARGLMQVMPHTGQLTADRLGWPYFGAPLLFEPEVAIEMAAWYFHELITQFQGQFPLAMAAYNAGPHRVKVWLEFKSKLPLDELIEEIPYAQAREYAKKVTRHLGLYRRIYLGYTGHLFELRVNPYPRGNINF